MNPYRRAAPFLVAIVFLPGSLGAQTVLDHSPLLSGGWVGTPGSLDVGASFRFGDPSGPGVDAFALPTFRFALGLPMWLTAGGQYAPQSRELTGNPAEWEVFGRYKALAQSRGAPLDVAIHAAYSGAAESVDGELSLARWFGPLRALAAGRVFSDFHDSGETRGAIAGGAVFYPMPRSMPIALTGDAVLPLSRRDDERVAWSAGLLVGVPYTVNTLSLFATNTPSGTLQGTSRGESTRWGLELTLPIPAGRFLGWYTSGREVVRPITAPTAPTGGVVSASIYRYAFVEDRIEVPVGTTIRWTNYDAVIHTVSADDASWNSGAIGPGEDWSGTFSAPGTFPFHCGPHPFMKGVVVVR